MNRRKSKANNRLAKRIMTRRGNFKDTSPRFLIRFNRLHMQHLTIPAQKRIALVAHDNRKGELIDWVREHLAILKLHILSATGTTGTLIERDLGLSVVKFKSGPLGGDQQIGAKIAEGDIDCLLFFWDPLEPQPHDPDVKALIRLATLWNIPVACNRATADFIVSSPLLQTEYTRRILGFEDYLNRFNEKSRT
jgi:methylglyoxal synthase